MLKKKLAAAILGALMFSPVILPPNNFWSASTVCAEAKTVEDLCDEGWQFIKDENYDEALKCFIKANEINPSDTSPLYGIKAVYIKLENLEETNKYIRKCIELNQNNAENLLTLAVLLLNPEDENSELECIEVLKRALSINPNNADILKILGGIYCMLEDYTNALKYLQNSVELNPNDGDSWLGIAFIYSEWNDFNKAIECSKKALDINPDNDNYLNSIGVFYAESGDYETAIGYLKKAVDLNPQASYWSSLGRCYELQGKYSEAKNCYINAVELDSKNETYKSRLENILAKLPQK